MLRIYWYCDSWEGWIGGNPPNCYKKVISGSKDIVKSADTEGVELSVYPDSGSLDSPPEVEMLVGGKRKGKSKKETIVWW